MRKYIIKRILGLIPVLILVSIFSYLIIQAAPGTPIDNYITPTMTLEEIEAVKVEYGLDGNVAQQYLNWLKHVLQGDFGTSITKHTPVTDMIAERLPATLLLMGTSLIISIVVSIPLGLWAGLHKNKFVDKVISVVTYLGISVPPFWFAKIGRAHV